MSADAQESSTGEPTPSPQINSDSSGRSVLAQFAAVLSGDAVSAIVDGVRALFIARILGPVGMGVWTQISLVLSVTEYSHAGLQDGMERETPLALGRQDQERVDAVERTTFGVTLATSAVAVALIGVGLALFAETEVQMYWWAWVLLMPMVLCSETFEFVMLSLECRQRFEMTSALAVAFSLFSAVLSVSLAVPFGVAGVLGGVGIAYAVLLFVALRAGARLPKPAFIPSVARDLFRVGFPMMAADLLALLLIVADRLLIWLWLDTEALGTYAVTSMVLGAVDVVPAVLAIVLFPRIMHTFGRTGEVESLHPYFERPTIIMSACASLAIGGLCMLWPFALTWVLPGYEAGILPGQILLLGSIFLVASDSAQSMLEAAGRQRRLLAISAFAVCVGISADVIALRAGWGLVGVACGTALAFAVDGVLVFAFAVREVRLPGRTATRVVVSTLFPYAVTLIAIAVVRSWRETTYASWQSDIAASVGQAVVVVGSCFAALIVVHLRTGAFSRDSFVEDREETG